MLTRWVLVLLLCGSSVSTLCGQQVTVGLPAIGINNDFFENTGVRLGVGYSSPTSRFFFNNGLGAPPAFGGFDPNSATNFGWAGRRGNWSWDVGLTAAQGSSRNYVSNTPTLTLPNGGSSFLSHTTIRPFVTGIVPVVNDRVMTQTPLEQQRAARYTERARFKQRFARAAKQAAAYRRAEQEEQRKLAEALERQACFRSSASSSTKHRGAEPPLILRGKQQNKER